MQITVNQYSVAYDVGLSQLYDNQLNSSLQCSSEHSTTTKKKHRTKYAYPRNPPRQNHLSFPTNADLLDNLLTRRYPTPTPYFRKLFGKWLFSQFRSIFIFFRVFINNFLEGASVPGPSPRTPMTKAFAQTTRVGCTTNASYSRRDSFERRFSCEETVCRPHPTPQVFQTDILTWKADRHTFNAIGLISCQR